MATVYRVIDPRNGQLLALKLLTRQGCSIHRFYREYRALARLQHPSVVRVYDFGLTSARLPYLTMELVEGVAVQVHVKAVGRPGSAKRTREVLRVAAQIIEALCFLHDRGLVHRDIKSSNVMVQPDGRVRLLDLGTVTAIEVGRGSMGRNEDSQFLGTVAYASPEQIRGARLDARSDLYTFGVLLYRMLTGRAPFQAEDSGQLADLQFTWMPPSPSSVVREIPSSLSALVMELLAKEPSQRPSSSRELLLRLEAFHPDSEPEPGPRRFYSEPPLLHLETEQAELRRFCLDAPPGASAIFHVEPGSGEEPLLLELRRWCGEREIGILDSPFFEDIAVCDEIIEPWKRYLPRDFCASLRELPLPPSGRIVVVLEEPPIQDESVWAWIRELRSRVEVLGVCAVLLVVSRAGRLMRELLLRGTLPGCARFTLPLMNQTTSWRFLASVLGQAMPPPGLWTWIRDCSGGRPALIPRLIEEAHRRGALVDLRSPVGTPLWADGEALRQAPQLLLQEATAILDGLDQERRAVLEILAFFGGHVGVEVIEGLLTAGGRALLTRLVSEGLVTVWADGTWSLRAGPLGEMLLDDMPCSRWEPCLERCGAWVGQLPEGSARVRVLVHLNRMDEARFQALSLCSRYLRELQYSSILEIAGALGAVGARGVAKEADPGGPGRVGPSSELLFFAPFIVEALVGAGDLREARRAFEASPFAGSRERARVEASLMEAEGDLRGAVAVLERLQAERRGSDFFLPGLQLVRLYLLFGDASSATVLLRELDRLAMQESSFVHAALLRVEQARLALFRGALQDSERLLRQAGMLLSEEPRAFADALFLLTENLVLQGRFTDASRLLEDLSCRLRSCEDHRLRTRLGLAWCRIETEMFRLGQAQSHLEEARLCFGGATSPVHVEIASCGWWPELRVEIALADLRIAIAAQQTSGLAERVEASLATARASNLRPLEGRLLSARGLAFSLDGRIELGQREAEQALAFLEGIGDTPGLAIAVLNLTEIFAGEHDPEPLIARVWDWTGREGAHLPKMWALLARYRSRVTRGEPAARRSALLSARAHLSVLTHALSPEDRLAMRIHPWIKLLGEGLRDAPSVPGPKRRS